MPGDDLLEIGTIGKAHGLRGDVVVKLITNRLERVEPGSVLSTDRGELVVERSRPHQDRFVVGFAGFTDRTAAESLRGTVLRAEPIDDEGELWVHELVGSEVFDQDGVSRGMVASVQANPASDLLVLDSGHLVPLVFVVAAEEQRVVVDVPEGLFDLGG
jgi:16S rRNA processing protein RimM